MLKVPWLISIVIAMVAIGSPAYASHPTEGAVTLEALLIEALAKSPEVKSSEANVHSLSAQLKSTIGLFTPEVSLEGGTVSTRFDGQRSSGSVAYGLINWNLYHGGQDSAERSKVKLELKLATRELEQVRATVAREIARLYYESAFLLESASIQEKALVLNREQMKLALKKKSAGFTSEADVIEFELREATIESDLRDLQQQKASVARELSAQLGKSDFTGDLAVKGHLESIKDLPNRNAIIQQLSDNNPEVVEAKAELDISKIEKTSAKSGFLPKINFQAKYGKLANEESVFDDNNNYSVALMLSLPLFSGFSDVNNFSAASSRVSKAELQVYKKTIETRAEAESLYAKLETIQDRLKLEEKTLSRSAKYYEITLGEYRRGVKNSPDMVGAAERLLNSKIRNLELRRDYQINLIAIMGLVGSGPNDSKWYLAKSEGNSMQKDKEMSPGSVHEECMSLKKGQTLRYSFKAVSPLDFNIHYHVNPLSG